MGDEIVRSEQPAQFEKVSQEGSPELRGNFDAERMFGFNVVSLLRDRDYDSLTPFTDSTFLPPEQVLAVQARAQGEPITQKDVDDAADASFILGADVTFQVSENQLHGNGARDNLDSLGELNELLRNVDVRTMDGFKNSPERSLPLLRKAAAHALQVDESRLPDNAEEMANWFAGYSDAALSRIGRSYEALEAYVRR